MPRSALKRAPDLAIPLAAVVYAIALFLVGGDVHPVPSDATAECDGYLAYAAALRDGVIPESPFRPLGVPALIAAVAAVVPGGDPFFAARVVSAIGAGATLWLVYVLGRALGSRFVGLGAAFLLAANAEFALHGVLATSEAAFTAVVAGLSARLVAATRRAGGVTTRDAIWIGALAALAWSIRYQGLVFVVAALAWVALCSGLRRRQAWVAAATCAVAAMPQVVANLLVFGRAIPGTAARSVALKLDGSHDWSVLGEPIEGGTWHLLTTNAVELWHGMLRELGIAFGETLPFALGGGLVGDVLAWALVPLAVAMSLGAKGASPARGVLLVAVAYLAMLCFAFYAWTRLLHPIVPLLTAFAVWGGVTFLRAIARPAVLRFAVLGICVVVASFWVPTNGRAVAAFRADWLRESQDRGAHACARWVAARDPHATVVGSHRNVTRAYRFDYYRDDAAAAVLARGLGDSEYFEELERELRFRRADYALFSRASLGERPPRLVEGAIDVPFLEPVATFADAALYRVRAD